MKYLIFVAVCLVFVVLVSGTSPTTLNTAQSATISSTVTSKSSSIGSTITTAITSTKFQTSGLVASTIATTKVGAMTIISSTIKQRPSTKSEPTFYATNCYCTNYCALDEPGEGVADGVVMNGSIEFWDTLITLFKPSIKCIVKVEACGFKPYPTTSACLVAFSMFKPTADCKNQTRLRTTEVPVCKEKEIVIINTARKASVVREMSFDTSQSTSGLFFVVVVLISCLSTTIIIFVIKGMFSAGLSPIIKQPKQRFY
ncbi:minor M protein [Morelia viridis nidovirus]|uniref:Minor M protein n=1 Tax=Morelia viridis nidovirus TaxID=2016400 RepID=A0A6B9D0M9_9NIDO|nr:minor M protein [Morelia viridis nidovirus]QGW58075.1 minor M protein [Morelia viridis nidovirus]QGW58082.1 minor M protein [Morelia viridis nidovirus]